MKKHRFKDLILFENADFLAINKPHGISSLEDRAEDTNILSMAKNLFPDVQVCHRLDKDTSGVLVLAKNPEAYRHLSLQFQNRNVEKIYHAIVHGRTDFKNYMIDLPLLVKNHGIVKWDTKSGKESNTLFTTLQNFKTFSFVECKPITGRRHQIRVHLKYGKHPIVADTLYDGEFVYLSQIKRKYKQSQRTEKPLINRMALHAYSISFKTLDGKVEKIEAPYPKDYSVFLKQLEKYGN
ncbi:MAG: RluA family pseudouridine synthase [Cyclobacteriaceae bacterium]|nr:RluA family pseudouridine synthase [Cyclobacteriaceae bacterium]